jgi:hypothetical protein
MDNDAYQTNLFSEKQFQVPSRMRGGRCLVYTLLVVLGLSIGLWIGFSIGGFGREKLFGDSGETTEKLFFGPNQDAFLVVGVDHISPQAELVSLWFVAYLPDQPLVTLVPLYPGSSGAWPEGQQVLLEVFSLGADSRPNRQFLEAVDKQFNLRWNGYVLLDQFAMIQIIDFLGGVDLGEGLENGATVVGRLPPPSQDRQGSLQSQARLLAALCDRISPDQVKNDLDVIQKLIPTFLITDLDLEKVTTNWLRLAASTPPVRCKFPTIEVAGP